VVGHVRRLRAGAAGLAADRAKQLRERAWHGYDHLADQGGSAGARFVVMLPVL